MRTWKSTSNKSGRRGHAWSLCLTGAAALVMLGCESLPITETLGLLSSDSTGELSVNTIVAGLKEALQKGTDSAVSQLSAAGGFTDNPSLRIPLPEQLDGAASALRKVGLGSLVTGFEDKMNLGAEKAVAKAKPVFWQAITNMSFDDAKSILQGGDTAATEYFRKVTSDDLRGAFAPIIGGQLESVGAVRAYNDLVTRYTALPFTKKPTLDLEGYATDKALDGLFSAIANEEKAIREDPVARTTDLLKKVFGKR
ncbi:MAG: DUF4197 domain-containing protein [Lentisphaeria bacterium]|nr:DUF4197 domain-containing protein [Lentisphaeria bacterium]